MPKYAHELRAMPITELTTLRAFCQHFLDNHRHDIGSPQWVENVTKLHEIDLELERRAAEQKTA